MVWGKEGPLGKAAASHPKLSNRPPCVVSKLTEDPVLAGSDPSGRCEQRILSWIGR